MFALKEYQLRALNSLRVYLRTCIELKDADTAFYQATKVLHGKGLGYKPVQELPGLPYVCIRIPTGGGKTLVAAHAAGIADQEFVQSGRPVILWLAPTTAIVEQTIRALKDNRHPYRQALEGTLGPTSVCSVAEALYVTPGMLSGGATVLVSTIQSFRIEETDGRKVYEDSGLLMDHFLNLPPGVERGLERHEHGGVKRSLANVLRMHRPIVIVDEAHNARTALSFDTLARFDPACIVEFTATPATKATPSNVVHSVSVAELHAEQMIKMPIKLETRGDWEELLTDAVGMLNELQKTADTERQQTGEYIRPIMLIQAQSKSQVGVRLTPDVVKQKLMTDHRIPEEQIAKATGSDNELPDNIGDASCKVRYVITVQQLREGWDCPFAYVLCSVAELHASTAVEQILGRVMRLPAVKPKRNALLNSAYAFAASKHFLDAASALKEGLVQNGFDAREADDYVQPMGLQGKAAALPLFGGSGAVGSGSTQQAPSPAEKKIPFAVPVLAVKNGDLFEQLEEDHFCDAPWTLAGRNWRLTAAEFQHDRPPGEYGEIDVGTRRELEIRFVGALHEQVFSLLSHASWSAADLAYWMDRNIHHPDITPEDAQLFLLQMVQHLVEERGLSLETLVRDKYRLREAARKTIEHHRGEVRQRSFQQLLLDEERLVVSPERCFQYDPDHYPYGDLYSGNLPMYKHYYKHVGSFDSAEEELCAAHIATRQQVKHWVRNLSNRPQHSFWLQTWTDKFYPDFVCELMNGKYLVVEYKGALLADKRDTAHKEMVGELWAKRSDGRCFFVMAVARDFDAIDVKIQEALRA